MMFRLTALFLFIAAAMPAIAAGQTVTEQGLRPVDATVEDVDPLGRSLRVVEPGLRTTGDSPVFQLTTDGAAPFAGQRDQRLYFVTRGFTASFDRSEYGVQRRTGRTFAAVPPNTVFHISPPKPAPPMALDPGAGDSPLRIDGRATQDRPHHAPPLPASEQAGQAEAADDTDAWAWYAVYSAQQRSLVVESLGGRDVR